MPEIAEKTNQKIEDANVVQQQQKKHILYAQKEAKLKSLFCVSISI
jgi:hypothetical protein